MRKYNRQMALMLKEAEKMEPHKKEIFRIKHTSEIQENLLKKLDTFKIVDRKEILKVFAYDVYKSEKSIHDSILWISDREDLRGTASDMIDMLCDLGMAARVTATRERKIIKSRTMVQIKQIRLWSKQEIELEKFSEATQVIVTEREAVINETTLNLGEENSISAGSYEIKEVAHVISRKTQRPLKKSISVLLF